MEYLSAFILTLIIYVLIKIAQDKLDKTYNSGFDKGYEFKDEMNRREARQILERIRHRQEKQKNKDTFVYDEKIEIK